MKSLFAESDSISNSSASSSEYYVSPKKSRCTLSPEERLGNLSQRPCQQIDFLVHSFNPLIFHVKTLKPAIFL